jgi:putative nucleotidyltransferase with HDIG domain
MAECFGVGEAGLKSIVPDSTDLVSSQHHEEEFYFLGVLASMNKSERADDGWKLLTEFTASESLRKHALSVEACMRAYARKLGGDENKWALVGLIHDFDYEKYPSAEEHPFKGSEILKERGYPEDVRRAILSHADYTGVTRDSQMEKALFACDELAGFITATALVKPNKSLAEVDARSVRKRMKDKAFARSVSRDDIVNGTAGLGVDLDEHITFCIEAMKGIAAELGLVGVETRSSEIQGHVS